MEAGPPAAGVPAAAAPLAAPPAPATAAGELEQLRARAAKAQSVLDEVAALTPIKRSPIEGSPVVAAVAADEQPEVGVSDQEPQPQPQPQSEPETSPEPQLRLVLAEPEPEPLDSRRSPALTPSTATPHSPPRDRADFIRKSTPGGWDAGGLAADGGAVMFNHERVGVHALDRPPPLIGGIAVAVGSQWLCVSQAGVSSHAQFAAAMASGRWLTPLERSGIEASIVHVYQPGDRITVLKVLVSDDPTDAERRVRADAEEEEEGESAAAGAGGEEHRPQIQTERGWVNMVSRSGKVLFSPIAPQAGSVSGAQAAATARREPAARGCLCLPSARVAQPAR